MREISTLIAALLAFTPIAIHAQSIVDVNRQIADARATMMVDPVATKAKALMAAGAAKNIGNSRQRRLAIATTEWLRSEASSRLGEIDKAEPLIAAAAGVVLRDDPQSDLAGEILLTRGGLRNARTQVAGSLSDYQRAFLIFRYNDDRRSQAIALMLMSILYRDGNDISTALRYITQASEVYSGDPGLMVALYNNRGGMLQDLGRYGEAEAQLRAALILAEGMKSRALIAQVLRNIARNRLKAGNFKAAEQAIRRSLSMAAVGEGSIGRPQLLALAAEAAFQRGRFEQAAALIQQSFAGIDFRKTEMTWREPHETAYRVFTRLGRYGPALQHLAALKRIEDRATTLATNTSNALMAARFDFSNQELRIAKLKADELRRSIALEQARARVQKIFFMAIGGATAVIILILAIGLFMVRRSRNEVRAARDGLAVTNDALAKALVAKTEFLATTSHEIRTPLNGILGMTQVMLADGQLPTTTRDRLTVVQDAGLTMRALVDDILDVAKMETGRLTIERAPFDLFATIADAGHLWEDQARAKGLDFELKLAACPHRVVGDQARVRQIVVNLLSNAVKFTAAGGVCLSVEPVGDGSQVAIVVSDTGIGIDPATHDAIFESFRQADASTTRQYGGTGLGLAICRNIAEAMDGTVTVQSMLGEGATFTVTLPLEEAAGVDSTAAVTLPAAALLVFDRNPITRSMWKTLLERRAGRLLFVSNIADALAAIRDDTVTRILIDEATLCADADADPATAVAAIVAAAAATGAETTLLWTAGREGGEALAVGMTRMVAKPVSGAALATALFGPICDEAPPSPLVSQAA